MPIPVGAGRVPRVHRTMMIGAPGDWRGSSSLVARNFRPNREHLRNTPRSVEVLEPTLQSVSQIFAVPPTPEPKDGSEESPSLRYYNRQPSTGHQPWNSLAGGSPTSSAPASHRSRRRAARTRPRPRPFDGLSVLSAADFPHSRRPQCADDCFPG